MNKPYQVQMINDNTAEILLYGYVGYDDNSAHDFTKELQELDKVYQVINLRINSGGGEVFEGMGIYQAIRRCKAEVNVYIDGLCASMATIIACSGKKVYMSKIGMYMTHAASSWASGKSGDLRKQADLLDGLNKTMASIYAQKTGKTKEQCLSSFLNEKDKWFTAEEAKAEGLIDEIFDAEEIDTPKATNEKEVWHHYHQYKFAAILTQKQNENMKQVFLSASALQLLAITADADAALVDAKISELVAKAAKTDELKQQLTDANTAKTNAENALQALKDSTAEKEVTDLLAAAQTENKITADGANKLKEQFKGKPAALKSVLDVMQPHVSVVANLKAGADANDLAAKSWNELDRSGQLEELRAKDENVFFDKFRTQFHKTHKDDKRA